MKVFFSRQFESVPKVEAWVIGNDSLFKVSPKSITLAKNYFTAKISLNTERFKNPHMHWTAYLDQEINESINTLMQSVMTLSRLTPEDLLEMVKKYESSNLLYLTDTRGQNLAHAAAQAGNTKLLKILIDKGVDFDLKDIRGWTPLTTAINAGALEAANFLISKNASVTSITMSNGNLLHYLMKSPRKC